MRRVWDYLQSKRFALVLLIIMVVLITVSTLIPQKPRSTPAELKKWRTDQPTIYQLAETAELNNIYNSKIFFLTLFFILISICLCTYNHFVQTVKAHRNWKSKDIKKITQKLAEQQAIPIPMRSGLVEEICTLLRKRLYSVWQEERLIIARKNGWALWAKVGFHSALVIIVAGALFARSTRLEGYVKLTEGEVFTEKHSQYQRLWEGPFFRGQHQDFQVRLDDVQIGFWPNGRTKKRQSLISIGEQDQLIGTGITRPNYPVIYKGYTILQGSDIGWSAILVLRDQQGRENAGSVTITTAKYSRDRSGADFLIPGTDFSAKAELQKAPGANKNKKFWMEYSPDDLILKIKVKKKKDRTILYDGKLRLNQEIELEDKLLTLRNFSPWTSFVITRDIGTPVIYFGFGMAFLGLATIFLAVPKKILIMVSIKDDNLLCRISGKSLKYHGSFKEELSKIRSLIQKKG